jgi:hypothetical protein
VSSRKSAARALRSSPPAQRVASREWSWFEPNQRLAAGRRLRLDALDDRPHLRRLQRGAHEVEVLHEVEAVVVGEHPRERHVRLPHQRPLRVVLLGDLLPAAKDLVCLRPFAHVAHAVT